GVGGGWGGRGFVWSRCAQPRIPKPKKKRARLFVGGFLRACGALGRFLPAISDLLPHDIPPLEPAARPSSPARSLENEFAGCPSLLRREEALSSSEQVGKAKRAHA